MPIKELAKATAAFVAVWCGGEPGRVVYTTRLNISRLSVTERGGRPGLAGTLSAAVMCEETRPAGVPYGGIC